jgi:lysophospholipid acyltransferase (LPLAT)-like uncharacterized protein
VSDGEPGSVRPAKGAWKVTLGLTVGMVVLRLLAHTWRLRVLNDEGVRASRANRVAVIFSLWHGELLPLLWVHRGEGVSVMISSHRDGEIVARVAEALGYGTVRGSSTRGGARALLAAVRALQAGHDLAVTPDGPRGPRHSYAPGAIAAAQRAGAPIVVVRAHASRAWTLRSWDRFIIPKPFARLTVAYSEPTRVDATSSQGAEAEAPRFAALMEAVGQAAEASA